MGPLAGLSVAFEPRASCSPDLRLPHRYRLAKHKEAYYLSESAKQVGTDEFGNEYWEDNSAGRIRGRNRPALLFPSLFVWPIPTALAPRDLAADPRLDRWVIYSGAVFDYPYQVTSPASATAN